MPKNINWGNAAVSLKSLDDNGGPIGSRDSRVTRVKAEGGGSVRSFTFASLIFRRWTVCVLSCLGIVFPPFLYPRIIINPPSWLPSPFSLLQHLTLALTLFGFAVGNGIWWIENIWGKYTGFFTGKIRQEKNMKFFTYLW
jgi:hypothetical protein